MLRILVAIASYGTKNDGYLASLLAEYRSMSHQVDIVVFSNVFKELGPSVQLVLGLPSRDPWSLPFAHKQLFADRLEDYDLFIYSEDDTLITEDNVEAFLRLNRVLRKGEVPGYLRVERDAEGNRNYPEVHGRFHWDPESVRSRGEYTVAHFTNEHSACYVLTRDQLRAAIESRGFLTGPHQGEYDLICTAATDPFTQCGFQKLICISHLEEFLVHHLPNRYIGTRFGVGEDELRRQVETLLQIGRTGRRAPSLLQNEPKLAGGRYSKGYYEPVRPDVVAAIPGTARSVLSIGCGWGATEGWLVKRGLRVVAVPLDPVISCGVEARGVRLVQAGLSGAIEELAGERFDCLLILNLLHLVRDPSGVLRSFAELLAADSRVIVSVPNLCQVPALCGKITGDGRFTGLGNYETTGVHFTSHRTGRAWFRHAGLRLEKTTYVLPPRVRYASRLTLGVADGALASELIWVGIRR
jgi:2-polyprenyl-3-methyl-5-hydroxy-6-metoxy-1,4-benzoquinol methylase